MAPKRCLPARIRPQTLALCSAEGKEILSYPFDPTPLAIHLLSVELLLVWLPFGKLAHAFLVFIARGITGAEAARRGAGF